MQAPSLRRCTCFEWLWSRLSLYVACYDSGHQVTSDHGRKAVTSAKCQKTIQYVLTSNQKHQKQAQWMKQAKKINTFFWDFYRQDSWGLQMTPGLVSWLNWIRSGAGTNATEGGRSEGIFDSVWKQVFSYFLRRKARLWLSPAKSIIFFRRWIGFMCLKQNSRIFSCLDFHCQSTLVPHCVLLSSLCLQELLLPVSPTRVVQAHHCRAICSERFERQSTSFFYATRKHLLVLMIVVLAVWCIQDFSTLWENIWRQPL